MPQKSFVYVVYIRTTPDKLWEALTGVEFNRKYWFGYHQETSWREGAPWKLVSSDGRITDSGEVLEIERPKRLVLKWRNEFMPELKEDGYTRCTITLEPEGEVVKLTVLHEADRPHKLIDKVSSGWPQVLSSLKSMIETGAPLSRADAPLAHREKAAQ